MLSTYLTISTTFRLLQRKHIDFHLLSLFFGIETFFSFEINTLYFDILKSYFKENKAFIASNRFLANI